MTQIVRDGWILDYISWLEVKATPEEVEAVQVFSQSLVEDYGYPKNYIQTRPQFRVKQRPSDSDKKYPVDIAIFKSSIKNDDTIEIIVECKKKSRKDWITQLEDYLRLSKASLWVWFNGMERLFLKKIEKNGKVFFEEIPNIPRFGERLEDIWKFRRQDLRKPHNLKSIFRAIRNHLAWNTTGATRDEVLAQQLINLVFCKIYDERFTRPEDIVSFRAWIGESHDIIRDRIFELFEKVKSKYNVVIDVSDLIILDPDSIVYIVWELQNYSLIESERDVIADAFETFIGYALKWAQWQFFTPRNVVKLMVELVDPIPWEVLIDPACWSWGFLVESLKHKWEMLLKDGIKYGWSEIALNEEKIACAMNDIRWIENDEFLSKVAKAYMAILWDGKGGIFCEDSLKRPTDWKDKTRQGVELWKFDVLLANPPFGKDIHVVWEDKLKQYDLAYSWKESEWIFSKTNNLSKSETPQICFIERSFQLLRKWGRLGIILPETFFHAPNMKYVFDYMKKWNNITWIIDLPHNTFRPYNNAKCIVVIIEKWIKQQAQINMAVAEEMWHDHQWKPIYRWDDVIGDINKNDIWDDIESILKEVKSGEFKRFCFKIDYDLCNQKEVFVPRYYWENKVLEIENIAINEWFDMVPISQLIDEWIISFFDWHGSPPAEYKWMGDVPYIRVKDIVNWEIYKDPTAKITEDIYLSKKWKKKELQIWDIVYVRRWSYRIWSIAMVSPFDQKVLLTREILVLRILDRENIYGIDEFYLLYLLSHRLTQLQTQNKVLIETTLPNIGDRWKELLLPISKDPNQRKRISSKIQEVMKSKWTAIENIELLKKELGHLTT